MNVLNIGHGLVHVYTGDGKGKTTAALGIALRVLGWGGRVCVVQFIKGYADIGEARFAADSGGRFELRQFARDATRAIGEQDVLQRRDEARAALEFAARAVESGEYDLVILDEVNNALHYNLIDTADVISLIERRPPRTELVLTGRNAPDAIVQMADYVTSMTAVKHPYQQNRPARRGIDY